MSLLKIINHVKKYLYFINIILFGDISSRVSNFLGINYRLLIAYCTSNFNSVRKDEIRKFHFYMIFSLLAVKQGYINIEIFPLIK